MVPVLAGGADKPPRLHRCEFRWAAAPEMSRSSSSLISPSPAALFAGGVRADVCHRESLKGRNAQPPRFPSMSACVDRQPIHIWLSSPPSPATPVPSHPDHICTAATSRPCGVAGRGPPPPPLLVLCCPAACQPSPWVSPSPSHDFSHVPQLETPLPSSPQHLGFS